VSYPLLIRRKTIELRTAANELLEGKNNDTLSHVTGPVVREQGDRGGRVMIEKRGKGCRKKEVWVAGTYRTQKNLR